MATVPIITMNNGLKMPAFGLGTYISTGDEGVAAVRAAIDIGYRHFDTALLYENEGDVGSAVRGKIAEGVISREDVFVVTKLWNTFHAPDKVEYACRKSLQNLGLEYIDLYLMHYPVSYEHQRDEEYNPKDSNGKLVMNDVDYVDTWKAMEQLVKLGLVKSIGISNFNSEQIERLLRVAEIKPVTNQVECSPELNQKQLIQFCKERDMIVTAYRPLGKANSELKTPAYLYDDRVLSIAAKHQKSAAQIVLRYLVELGTVPIPKSVTKSRIEANIDIFDFTLSTEELAVMNSFHTGKRRVGFIDGQHLKYWPFGIEF